MQVLPANPKALAVVDWQRLSDEGGMTGEDWKELLPDEVDFGSCGIDRGKKFYAFVSSEETLGFLMPVSDEDDLKRTFEEFAKGGKCTPVEESRGCCWTILDDVWMVGFDHRALLVAGPATGADKKALRYEMQTCFKQGEEESGKSSPLFKKLEQKDASFRLVSRLDMLPAFRGMDFLTDLPEEANLSDMEICADINISSRGITLEAEIESENPDVERYFEKMAQFSNPLDGSYADNVPTDALAWACVNVDGTSLLENLRKNPTARTFLIGLNMAVDADMMLKSVKGDVAVTFNAPALQGSPGFLLTARLTEKDFLKESAYWKESAERNGLKFRDFGNNRFYMATPGTQAYFGVDGETFYVTPDEGMTGLVDAPETKTLSEWKGRIKDSRLFLWLNLEQAKRHPRAEALLKKGRAGGEKLDLFDAVVLRLSDARHLTLELHTRENRNLLRDLLK